MDFDEDLNLTDIFHAHQEGFDNVELLKRYSTVGMGPSQGKLANMNSVRVLSRLNQVPLGQTGTTSARPFYQPVRISHLAGKRFHPHRLTPIDAWHRSAGAEMIHVGAWFRPEYYTSRGKSRADCVLDEARNVRHGMGLIDISTLGKYMVSGTNAARFLEKIYTGRFAKQKPGSSRYAIACDESGILYEEGLVARLSEDRFYLTGTTSGSATFFRELQRWALILGIEVNLANVTGHWAAMNLAGSVAREILSSLTDTDLELDSFPTTGVKEATVAGAPALIIRSGFVGELSYEVHLGASDAHHLWASLMEAGRAFNISPFGTEAQRLLRLEKGHLILNHDTDALTHPFEVGMHSLVKMDKEFFVGKRSLEILQRQTLERKLVGITFAPDYRGPFPEECQLVIHQGDIAGRVTSIAERTTLGQAIGMAFVIPELASPGTQIPIRVGRNQYVQAEVASMPFYDKEGDRLK